MWNDSGMKNRSMEVFMKNRLSLRLKFAFLWLALSGGLGAAGMAAAEQVYLEHERHGAWEMGLQYSRVGGERISGVGSLELDTESGSGWGAGIGYNFNNQLLVGMEFLGATQRYRSELTTDEGNRMVHQKSDFSSTLINGTWHFLPGGVTPFVTVGAGWTNVDSNISNQAIYQDCWWDPWWGYSCSGGYSTHNDTKTTLAAAVGMRWDFHSQFFARVSYGKLWLDPDGNDAADPTVARIEFGIRR